MSHTEVGFASKYGMQHLSIPKRSLLHGRTQLYQQRVEQMVTIPLRVCHVHMREVLREEEHMAL